MTNYEYLRSLTVEEMVKWLHELCNLNEIAPDEKWLFEMLNSNCSKQRETPIRSTVVFDCSDCINYTDGKCDLDYPVDEYEDMYDCKGFEDAT